jgi:hypothetical protein
MKTDNKSKLVATPACIKATGCSVGDQKTLLKKMLAGAVGQVREKQIRVVAGLLAQ